MTLEIRKRLLLDHRVSCIRKAQLNIFLNLDVNYQTTQH